MATLSITIDNTHAARVNDAIAAHYGYQATIDGSPNPETKTQFVRRMVIQMIKEKVRDYEASVAAESARLTAYDSGSQLNIT